VTSGPFGVPETAPVDDVEVMAGLTASPNRATDAIACPDDASSLPIPYRDASGQILTNVYPLRAICVDANGAVVEPLTTSPATLPTTSWASPAVPLVGQHVELDADGNYSSVLVTPSPSPTPTEVTPSASSPSTKGGSGSPTPSKS
jgi:hypothetical protein